MKLTVELPWPERELWPNGSHRHPALVNTLRQEARREAGLSTLFACDDIKVYVQAFSGVGPLPARLTFHAPRRNLYDLQNVFSAVKNALDGVCEALEFDDYRLAPVTLERGPVIKGGCVKVEIGE